MKVPFFRPEVSEPEVTEVVATLQSGWLTTGPRVRCFEQGFASAVGASHAVAVKSGIATQPGPEPHGVARGNGGALAFRLRSLASHLACVVLIFLLSLALFSSDRAVTWGALLFGLLSRT